MTNEKAIMCLEDMKIKVPIPKAAKQARENNEALDVAIKALAEFEHSTNLAEVGTDCISRQAAIKAIEEEWDECCSEYPATQIIRDTTEAIERLPIIQPKRGKWHYSDGKPARIGMSFGVICDQCGTESEYCTNFCGECGADMRGEQNE